MKIGPKILLLTILIVIGMTGCTLEGNGSGVGTGMVTGKLYEPDGITPAQGALVAVHYRNTTALITSPGAAKTARALYTTQTDSAGNFEIDTLADGEYVIEGSDRHGNMVLYDSVIIFDNRDKLALPADTLEPAGMLSGKIVLNAGGNFLQVFILAFGIDRFCQISADGTFSFNEFAEGVYRIKIISLDPDYLPFDTSGIRIGSGDTVNLGSITLIAKERLPVPRNLQTAYDTATMRVDLSWEVPRSEVTKGFNIYRLASDRVGEITFSDGTAAVDTPTVRLNTRLITDPVYSDSSLYEAFTGNDIGDNVEYVVCMVDTNGNESRRSDPAVVSIVNNWAVVDSYTIPSIDSASHISDFVGDRKNNLWIACDDGKLLCFSSTGEQRCSVLFDTTTEFMSTFDLLPSCDDEGGTGMVVHRISRETRAKTLICYYVDRNGDTTRMLSWESAASGLSQEPALGIVARGKLFGSFTENDIGMLALPESTMTVIYEHQDSLQYLSRMMLPAGDGFAVVMNTLGELSSGSDLAEITVMLFDGQSFSMRRKFPVRRLSDEDIISASDSSIYCTNQILRVVPDGTMVKSMPPLCRSQNIRGMTVRPDGAIVILYGFGSDMLTAKLFTERK